MSYTSKLVNNLPSLVKQNSATVKQFFKLMRNKKPADLDYQMQEIHEEVFKSIDCLECANCCRSLGPRITTRDIAQLSKSMQIKPIQFIEQFLRIDEDNDYVFKTMPCPFLEPDNYCRVYENRPQACREYPHLDRRKFIQIIEITKKNREVCPAVYEAIELLQMRSKHQKPKI